MVWKSTDNCLLLKFASPHLDSESPALKSNYLNAETLFQLSSCSCYRLSHPLQNRSLFLIQFPSLSTLVYYAVDVASLLHSKKKNHPWEIVCLCVWLGVCASLVNLWSAAVRVCFISILFSASLSLSGNQDSLWSWWEVCVERRLINFMLFHEGSANSDLLSSSFPMSGPFWFPLLMLSALYPKCPEPGPAASAHATLSSLGSPHTFFHSRAATDDYFYYPLIQKMSKTVNNSKKASLCLTSWHQYKYFVPPLSFIFYLRFLPQIWVELKRLSE